MSESVEFRISIEVVEYVTVPIEHKGRYGEKLCEAEAWGEAEKLAAEKGGHVTEVKAAMRVIHP